MAWYVGVDFGAGLVDITAHVHGLSKSQRLHSELLSTVNTCSFRVDDPTIANDFLTSDSYCPVTITKDAAAWFKGYVRPTFSAQVSAGLDMLDVECVDAGVLLQKLIEDPISYASYKVCDTSTKTASILHQLFYAAGISDSDLALTTINKTIAFYGIDPADKSSYWDAISELCFEYGYVFYVNNSGVFTLVDLFPTSYSPGSLDDADVYHGLRVQKEERQYEAARVEWHPQRTLSNRVVFEDTTGGDGKTPCKIDLDPGGYYPEGAGTGDVYCEYRLDDYEIIKVTDASLKLSASGVATVTFTAGYKRALLKLYAAAGGTITKLCIRGDAVVRDLCQIRRSVRYVVPDSEKVFEYQAKWLLSASDAERLSNGIARWYEFADYTYQFPTEESMAPGSTWELDESGVLGVVTDVRIVEVTEDENGERQVQAEGMDEYTVVGASERDSVGGGGTEVHLPFELDEGAASPYEGWDSIPEGTELFDLSQPDCISSLGRRPSRKTIVYHPGTLKDEVGTEYTGGWSKFTGRGVVGSFGAVTNLVADPEDLTASSWTPSSATAAASSYTFAGRPFTKVTAAGSASGYVRTDVTFTSSAQKGISITIKKGTSNARFGLYDATAGAYLTLVLVNWTTKAVTVSSGSGTILRANWYGDEIVEVHVLTATVTYTNTNRLMVLGGSLDATYNYYTAVQVINAATSRPYTPTSTSLGSITYSVTMPESGTIELWILPFFLYSIGADKYVWRLGTGSGNNNVSLLYEAATDKWVIRAIVDSSNYRVARSTTAFASTASLCVWQHIKAVWDIPNQTVALYVDGVEQTDTASAGTITSLSLAGQVFFVGGLVTGYGIDAFLTDLLYRPDVKDTSTSHYTAAVPWYDPSEVANVVRSVRISQSGIRLHNAELSLTDDRNRSIEISPATGMLAKDAAGTVTHDLPNGFLISGMLPGGHIFPLEAVDYLSGLSLTYTDTSTSRLVSSAVTNVDISAAIPAGQDNVHAVLVRCALDCGMDAAKVTSGPTMYAHARYSTAYNSTPGTYNNLGIMYLIGSWAAAAHGIRDIKATYLVIPVFYVSGVPYVTWDLTMNYANMASASGQYWATSYLYVMALLF